MAIGIHGIGIYLPDEVRGNDWWPEEIVAGWRERQARSFTRARLEPQDDLTPGMRLVVDAMLADKGDPFEGAVLRHVAPAEMNSSEMEVRAARRALDAAGVSPKDVGILLVQSIVPDFLMVPNACVVHRELGLPSSCYSLTTDGMCNAFLQQLVLAEKLIDAGVGRYALIIQSSAMTRLARREHHFSPWFGDGAAATVVGKVADGRGILAHGNLTDGTVFGSVVTGIEGKRWYEGAVYPYLESPALARRQFLIIPDVTKTVLDEALAKSGLRYDDVDFWACHQPSTWLGRVTQAFLGMTNAERVDTYTQTASLSGANIPFVLATGLAEGKLRDGQLVAMFAGASGLTATGIVMRWGVGV